MQARHSQHSKPPHRKGGKKAAQHKPNFLVRITNAWMDRLLGAVADRSLADQEEEYASNQTKKDYIWNTAGLTAWGMVFPLLTIVVTQLVGTEIAGMFSLVFVTANVLMIIANYGVRTYQVSDLEHRQSFNNYQLNRWITCIAMMGIGVIYCHIRGYDGAMFTMSVCIYLYRMIDGLADVYEGRLQQEDKLYLAGVSQGVRSVLVLVAFTICLFLTHDIATSSLVMALVAGVTFVFITYPLALLETSHSSKLRLAGVVELFKQCFPLFVALFLYNFIDNMPKFLMDGVLSYDNQLYFNALYFPAQSIMLTVGFIYKPLLIRIAQAWADTSKRKRFDLFVIAFIAVIVILTVIFILVMSWIGIPIMSFLYGVDFEQFRALCIIMLIAGGVTGGIDFLYQIITVMRHQNVVIRLYLITFACSIVVPFILIRTSGIMGAGISYLIEMCVLFGLLVFEYIHLRMNSNGLA